MSLVSIGGGVQWLGTMGDESFSLGTATYVLDASGEKVQLICYAPRTGNLKRFECYLAAVGNVPNNGLKFSFQGVNLTTGEADAVVAASVTTAANTPAAASIGWYNPGNFNTTVAVTRGTSLMACVIEFSSFSASDSISFGNAVRTADLAFPYGISATNTKQASTLPIIALVYDDGGGAESYEYLCPEVWPTHSVSDFSMSTSTTPDEGGLAFSVPFPCALRMVGVFRGGSSSTLSDYDVVLYDSGGSVLATVSRLAEVSSGVTRRWDFLYLPADITLAINTLYRLVVKASSTGQVQVTYYVFNSAALMNTIEYGTSWYATARTDAGSWTDYNNTTDGFRRPRLALGIVSLDNGTGGSGGGLKLAGSGGLAG